MPREGLFDAGRPAMRQRAFILWRALWLKGFGLRDRVSLMAPGPDYSRSRLSAPGVQLAACGRGVSPLASRPPVAAGLLAAPVLDDPKDGSFADAAAGVDGSLDVGHSLNGRVSISSS